MRSKSSKAIADAAAWQRAIAFEEDLSPTAARELLKLRFSQTDLNRMSELAAKARAGTLTPEEERLISTYEQVACVLDIIHSKSRRVLKRRRTA